MLINKSYKFRMYPSKEQVIKIKQNMGCSRFVYNYMLNKKNNNIKLSKYEMYKLLPELKEENNFLKEADSSALQCSITNLFNGYEKYLKGKGEKPNYKKKGCNNSYRTTCIRSRYKGNEYSNIKIDMKNKIIKLPKIGEIKIKGYRKIKDLKVKILNATIKIEAGRYYACLCVEEKINVEETKGLNMVGIDIGIKSLVTTSNYEYYESKIKIEKYEKRIKQIQEELSRKIKGSRNYQKTKIKLERIYQRLRNSRKKRAEEIVSKIVKENDIIITENLQIQKMIEKGNKSLRKRILHSTFREIITKIEYKCKWLGKKHYKVSKYYASSQICSRCGQRNKNMKNILERKYKCNECGNEIERDYNATINILIEGMKQVTA